MFETLVDRFFKRQRSAQVFLILLCGVGLFAVPSSVLVNSAFGPEIDGAAACGLVALLAATPLVLFCVLAVRSLVNSNAGLAETTRELDERVAALAEARRAAEAANCTKSMFLAQMSHELRTPLNSIIGFSDVLANSEAILGETLPEMATDYVRTINRSGQHLLAIINDLLDLSRIEAGRYELAREEFDASAELVEIVDSLRPLASTAHQTLVCQPELPMLRVHADKKVFRQMLYNLLSNAVKYSGEQASVIVEPIQMRDGLSIVVQDDGPGMTPEQLEEAMTPFGRLENAFVASEGTGLGLPIVKSLIELEGGSVEIDSMPGQGTTVWIHYPASALVDLAEEPVATAVPGQRMRAAAG